MDRRTSAVMMPEHGSSGSKADLQAAAIPSKGMTSLVRAVRLASYVGLLAIAILSLVPVEWRPSTGLAKELEHAMAYSVVAAILTMSGANRWPHILAMVVLAGVFEFGQIFVPGRDPNLNDFAASVTGALLGFGLCSLVAALISRHSTCLTDDPASWASSFRLDITVATVAVVALCVAVVFSLAAAHGIVGWLGAGLALVMLTIAVIDGQHFVIPDPLNVVGLALGIVNSVVLGQGDLGAALSATIFRGTILAALFFGLRLIYARLRGRHGMGLGDVKLAAVGGIWLDWSVLPIAIEIAALSALAIYGLRRYVRGHQLRPTSRLPFGLFFAPAIWIGWLLQTTVLRGW